jgi:hypothetical protein
MIAFDLPYTTIVNRVIPKNSFDAYTTAKQKKLLADLVQRITWTHKLSLETTNLPGKGIKEIQIFKIELKTQEKIDSILLAIDKAIPYPIIFVVIVDQQMFVSTSVKHPHPVNEDNAVIDWTFKSEWCPINENKYNLSLKKSLDAAYLSLCVQLSDRAGMGMKSIQELVELSKLVDDLTKEVNRLKVAITGCRQFNQKVKLNVELLALENQLSILINKKGSVHTPNKI